MLGPLTCLIRVVGEAAVQLPVADTCPGDAAAAGTAELRGGAGGWGAATLVRAVAAVRHAVAAGAPGHALPAGAAVLVRGAARGADLVRAIPTVVLVVAEPGARHAVPAGAAGELRVGAAGLGRAGLGRGRALPQPGRARAAGWPWLSPGAWRPRARPAPGAAAAPGTGTPHSPPTHQFLQPCCTPAPAGKVMPSQTHGHSAGSMQLPSASREEGRCQQARRGPAPFGAAPRRPRAHRAAPSPRGRSSPPGTTWCRSARAAPGRSFGRSGGRGGRRRCTPAPRHTAWLQRQGAWGSGGRVLPALGRAGPPAQPLPARTPQPSPGAGDGDSRHRSWLLQRMWTPRWPHSSA